MTQLEARALVTKASASSQLRMDEMSSLLIALAVVFRNAQADLDSLRFRVEELERKNEQEVHGIALADQETVRNVVQLFRKENNSNGNDKR